ncbi:divalent cation tolerance protein CutA [Altererythrobacter salegens]|uniref:Divalent cation tolerance protein CutA n=1 Tax=Croceibacterium salegens TaxID=1737568 RepID=A0A6I4SWW3_9SPHN|nr:divalent cation tolerance protein CutA [Croceibacterium salegens]MXO60461.1 divalent cation tolerance protein CutA [Croceibacterium salegens]
MSAALLWSAFADEDSATATAAALLDEGLIACANIVPGVRSLFTWRGERGEAQECAVLFKTDASLLDRACARLAELHPYETPAVSGWLADATAAPTAAWLGELAGGPGL